ncbi:Uncharacterised protein [Vibrio cholerae]|nr:Uncharacterised protein [Vibrio cholerae]
MHGEDIRCGTRHRNDISAKGIFGLRSDDLTGIQHLFDLRRRLPIAW